MSVEKSPAVARKVVPAASIRPAKRVVHALVALAIGFAWLGACSSNPSNGGDNGGGSSSGSGGNSGGNGSNGAGSNSGGSNGSSGNRGGSSGASSSGGSGSNGGNSSSGSNGSSGGGSSGSSGTGSSSGIRDGGGDSTLPPGDGGVACTNTNPAVINIDSSGWACNNQWGIQGAWYCFAGGGTSNCTGQGDIPFNPPSNRTANAMCVAGVTGTPPSSTNFGAGVGLVLKQADHDAGHGAFNAANAGGQAIVGFAITISGDSGGSVLKVNFPRSAAMNEESPSVIVPGVSSAISPITYNVLFRDAFITDSSNLPLKLNPADLGQVEVAIPADNVPFTYDYCITKIVPITAPVVPANFGNYGPAFKNQTQFVLEGFGPYGIQNNPVGTNNSMSVQTMYGNGQVGFSAIPAFTSGGVGAFPAVVWGWVHGSSIIGSNDPGGYTGGRTVTSLTAGTLTSSWTYTAPGGVAMWDAAYDIWFSQAQDPINASTTTGTPTGLELMIWLGRGSNTNPVGGLGAATFQDPGSATWGIATGSVTDSNGTHPVISYVRSTPTASVTNLDLSSFFQDATGRGLQGFSGASFLLGVQAGFELYQPGTWGTNSFSVTLH